MNVAEFLTEIIQSLETEIEALSAKDNLELSIHDGEHLRESGGRHEYRFLLDRVMLVPEDIPISVIAGEVRTQGFVIGVDGLDIYLALDDSIGSRVPAAQLEGQPAFLVEQLLKRPR